MITEFHFPSWFDIEDRLRDEVLSRGNGAFITPLNEAVLSVGLAMRRVDNIRTAFYQAQWKAGEQLRQRFSDIDIADILNDLLKTVGEMAMIVAASALTGASIGAGVGALAGGVGALPGSLTGLAVGLHVSGWILGVLGLASVAEFFVDGLPVIVGYYLDGINVAWEGTRGDEGLTPFSQDDMDVVDRSANYIAQGHVEVVVLLLSAIVAYITRGRGDVVLLAREMSASSKGKRLAQWMLKHQDALKKRPDLQPAQSPKGGFASQEPTPPHRQNEQTPGRKPLGMPEHKVPCFSADKLHYSKVPEFDRQLGGQEKGLNNLTVDEYLRGREAYTAGDKVRDPKVAKDARKDFLNELTDRLVDELMMKGSSPAQAKIEAERLAKEKMATLAALHNPDLFAGGKDVISDFGDRGVNSSIGAQWPNRIKALDDAARNIDVATRASTKLNTRLERCR